jgi:uncharacterized surface protein with fasciclin (FAS1) repeats
MNTPIRRSLAAVTALVAAAGLAGCSSAHKSTLSPAATAPRPSVTPEDVLTGDLVGAGCAAYAAQVPTGKGAIAGMAQDGVATAASHNPMLTTLTAALSGKLNKKVNLVATLNSSDFTVFAPVNAAFAKLDPKTLVSLKSDQKLLIKFLTYHVVAGQLSSSQVVGTQRSVEGGDLKITRSGNALKVNGANVICGGIRTANATLYLIDSALSPPK